MKMSVARIDIHCPLYYSDLRSRQYAVENAQTGEYEIDALFLINDLRQLLVIVDGVPEQYIMKHSATGGGFVLVVVGEREAQSKLRSIKLNGASRLNVWDFVCQHKRPFVVRRAVFDFTPEDDAEARANSFRMFQGYRFIVLPDPDYSLIEHFLNHIRLVIASNDTTLYNYVLSWCAAIFQIPTHKNKVMLLIQGRQGSGKTLFTDAICKLLGDYGCANIKDPSNITGHFNGLIENKKLIVLNELVSSDDTTAHSDYNGFKTIVTEDIIDITRKGQDSREAMNIINLIITTNYMNALRFSGDDRRICPITSNNAYARPDDNEPDFAVKETIRQQYFDAIWDEIDNPMFNQTLFTFLMGYDISGFKPTKFPVTQARRDIIESNRSPIELTVDKYADKLVEGVAVDELYRLYQDVCQQSGFKGVYSKPKFVGELKRWTIVKQEKRIRKIYFNEEGLVHFNAMITVAESEPNPTV